MATYYVSNTISNGYGLGNDTTGNGTKATPYLTIVKAQSVSASGDIINVNPTATAYVVDSGSGYLNISITNLTVQTDPLLVVAQGKFIMQPLSGTSTRIVNVLANGFVLRNVMLDGLSNASLGGGVSLQSSIGFTVDSVDFKNWSNGNYLFNSTNATGTITKCTATSANNVVTGKFLDIASGGVSSNISITGCTGSGLNYVFFPSSSTATWTNVSFGAAAGVPNSFSNLLADGIRIPSGMTTSPVTIDSTNFSGTIGSTACVNIGSGSTAAETFTVSNCSFATTTSTFAIALAGTSTINILGNKFTNANSGVAITGTDLGSSITGNTFSCSTYGFYVSSTGNASEVWVSNNTFTSSNTQGVQMIGTVKNLRIVKNLFDSLASGGILIGGVLNSGVVISNNTFKDIPVNAISVINTGYNTVVDSNIFKGKGGLVNIASAYQTDIRVTNNTITQFGTSFVGTPIDCIRGYCGKGFVVLNNKITTDALANHAIIAGSDGFATHVTNAATSTSLQAFGSATSNNYFGQSFVYSASGFNDPQFAGFQAWFTKVGSPTGTINAYLYTNNAGSPGTLLATSELNASASITTGSAQQFLFTFDNRPTMAVGSTYWVVVKYTGTNNATDYLNISMNTSATSGKTSSDGVTWSGLAASALFTILVGNFNNVNPILCGNTVVSKCEHVPQMHAVFCGTTSGGTVTGNYIRGGGPLLIAKGVDGSVTPYVASANIIYAERSKQNALRDKGSRSANFVNNTVVVANASSTCATADNDFYVNTLNVMPCRDVNFQNNVFLCAQGGDSSVPLVLLGNGANTCLTPTLSNNLYYVYQQNGATDPILVNDARTASTVSYTSLSAWQTASSLDSGSVNIDPQLPGQISNFASISKFAPNLLNNKLGIGIDKTSIAPIDYYGVAYSTPFNIGALNPVKPYRYE